MNIYSNLMKTKRISYIFLMSSTWMLKYLFSSVPSFTNYNFSSFYFNYSCAKCSSCNAPEIMWDTDWTTPLQPGWVEYLLGVHCSRQVYALTYEKSEDSRYPVASDNHVGYGHTMYLLLENQSVVQLEVWCLQKSPSLTQSLYHNRPKNSEVQSLHKQNHNSCCWPFLRGAKPRWLKI